MDKQFVQVSAYKNNKNFMFCSNLGLMGNENMTPAQALIKLNTLATEYARDGYTIEWIREDFDPAYEEMYGDLFVE